MKLYLIHPYLSLHKFELHKHEQYKHELHKNKSENSFLTIYQKQQIINKIIGRLGEYITRSYLKRSSYQIVSNNWRDKQGEIDIICIQSNEIIFIEVKSQVKKDFQSDLAIKKLNLEKKNKVKDLADIFLKKHISKKYQRKLKIRFDGIVVHFKSLGLKSSYELYHYKGIWCE